MNSSIEPVALMLLRQGKRMSKYDLALEARCDQRTAHRIMTRLQKAHKDIRVVSWVRIYKRSIPVWGLGSRDVPRPPLFDGAKHIRNKRKNDPEFYMDELIYKRKRYANTHKSNPLCNVHPVDGRQHPGSP